MKKFILAFMILTLVFSLALPAFAEELDEATFIEKGKALIEEWGEVLMAVIDTIREYTPEDWRVVIDEQIVPWVSLVVTAVAGIYIAIAPVLYKIKKTSDIFNKSSDKLDESKEVAEKARKQLKTAQDELEVLRAEFQEVKTGYDKMVGSLSNIEKMTRIAFGNMDELINKGYASEIAKVGTKDEVVKENEAA